MPGMKSLVLPLLGALTLTTVCNAEGLSIPPLGVRAGVYLPQSTVVKDAFGSSLLQVGLGLASGSRPSDGSITPTINFIGANKNGNRFLLVPVMLGYEKHLGGSGENTVFYTRFSVGAAYYDYSIYGVSASKVNTAGAVELGVLLNKRLQLSVAYNAFQKSDNIDFNGISASIGLKF